MSEGLNFDQGLAMAKATEYAHPNRLVWFRAGRLTVLRWRRVIAHT